MNEDRDWMQPLYWSTIVMVVIATMFTWQEHRSAMRDREIITSKIQRISRLEDATRDMLRVTNRPIILYYCGERKPWDGYVIYWPESAEKLLGWNWADIQEFGLACMIPPELRDPHIEHLEAFVDVPVKDRKTSFIRTEAVHKDGHLVPVTMSVWVVGDTTRTVAATMDATANVTEK